LSALKTLGGLQQTGRFIAFRGDDVDTLIGWAVSELEQAEHASCDVDRRKHTTHAVGHAKRAVDCLFDAYLERDYLDIHLAPRAMFSAKLKLLKERFKQLPWRLIPAIVADPRDTAEHEREAPSVQDAGIAVEAARAVVTAMRSVSDPLSGPALAGQLSISWSAGELWEVRVPGLPSHFLWIWRCADGVARAGVGTSSAVDTAEVLYADLRTFSLQEHLSLLQAFDALPFMWRVSEAIVGRAFALAGLDQPK
jgi:hypothetical protein